MEWATFEAVVDGLTAVHDQGPAAEAPPAVAFMGLGEPLLHPRFLDMVRLAKRRGLRAEVTTNALLLDDELAAGLLEAGLDQLVVSIDGASAEAFGRVRSGASLDRVVENVRRLHDGGGPNYGPGISIGVEFVAMRSNVGELPGLSRLAARLGATFIIVSNVLAYTPELLGETLYDHRASSLVGAETTAAPRWRLPAFDWDEAARRRARRGAHALRAQSRSSAPEPESTRSHCPFVDVDACAVGWHGGVSPCPPLLHTYTCFVRGREKRMLRWEVGRLPHGDAGGGVGGAGVRRVPRPGPALRLPAMHRLRLRAGRDQRRGLSRQPAPDVRRLPVGARRRALRLSRAGAPRGAARQLLAAQLPLELFLGVEHLGLELHGRAGSA